jgi:CheY-like chemotaxis protein
MKPPCILIVDDDPSNNELLSLVLTESMGATVTVAENGKEALDSLSRSTVDLMLLDISMPGMDGLEVLRLVRQQHPSVRVVMLTAFPGLRDKAMRAGASDFVAKPYDPKDLGRTIECALSAEIGPLESTPDNISTVSAADASPRPADLPKPEVAEFEGGSTRDRLYPFVVGGLLHDALNVVQTLRFRIAQLGREDQSPDIDAVRRVAGAMSTSAEHLSRVLGLLQQISRHYYKTDAEAPADTLLSFLDTIRLEHPAVPFAVRADPRVDRVPIPTGVMVFLVGEIVENAIRAVARAGGGSVDLTLHLSDDTLSVECLDAGDGFPAEILERIYGGHQYPPRHGGTGGYGLYLVHEVLNRLGGQLLASNRTPRGARVELLIPVGGLLS